MWRKVPSSLGTVEVMWEKKSLANAGKLPVLGEAGVAPPIWAQRSCSASPWHPIHTGLDGQMDTRASVRPGEEQARAAARTLHARLLPAAACLLPTLALMVG